MGSRNVLLTGKRFQDILAGIMKRRHITRKVFEVSLGVPKADPAAADVLRNVLMNAGIRLEDLIEEDVDGRKVLAFYDPSFKRAQNFERKLKTICSKTVEVRCGVLYQDDWLTRWKKDWKPFALTSRLDVVPVWRQEAYTFGKRDYILLDTISSFGTGLHETTRFMAQFVETLQGKFNNCLDVGTGTGILALVALKGGAAEACAIDLDEMCVKAASANFKANGYPDENIFNADLRAFKPGRQFDFVCANLVMHDLVKMKRKIVSFVEPGGWLAVSGVSLENLPFLRRGFENLPLRCVKIQKGTKWAAVLFRKDKA